MGDYLSRYRISTNPHDSSSWTAEQSFNWQTVTGWNVAPNANNRVSYHNLFYLPADDGGNGRLYNFSRGTHQSANSLLFNQDHQHLDLGRAAHHQFLRRLQHRLYQIRVQRHGSSLVLVSAARPTTFASAPHWTITSRGVLDRRTQQPVINAPIALPAWNRHSRVESRQTCHSHCPFCSF